MGLIAEASGTRSQYQRWFSEDISPHDDSMVYVHFAVGEGLLNTEIEYTLDGGQHWVTWGVGASGEKPAAAANSGVVVSMPVAHTSLLNIRHTNSTDKTILFCLVHV